MNLLDRATYESAAWTAWEMRRQHGAASGEYRYALRRLEQARAKYEAGERFERAFEAAGYVVELEEQAP